MQYIQQERNKRSWTVKNTFIYFSHENVKPMEGEAESVFFSSLSKPFTVLRIWELLSKYFWIDKKVNLSLSLSLNTYELRNSRGEVT